MANTIKIKRPRKVLTEKYLLDLAGKMSSVNFEKAISLQ